MGALAGLFWVPLSPVRTQRELPDAVQQLGLFPGHDASGDQVRKEGPGGRT